MNMLKKLFALLATSMVVACGGSDGPTELPFKLIQANWQLASGIGNYVYRDERTLQVFWGTIVSVPQQPDGSYQLVFPTVDYTQQMVVGMVRGYSTSSCSGGLTITKVLNDGEHIQVHATLSLRSPGGLCTGEVVMTPNTAFATIPRSDLPVTFVVTSN